MNALNNYWKLRAIGSMEMPSSEETDKVISVLIDNEEIKGILTKDLLSTQAVIIIICIGLWLMRNFQ
jgi:hypothetical protein